jgi:GNAT superfamily N-acetyltransferase
MKNATYELIPATVTFLEMHHRPVTEWQQRPASAFHRIAKPLSVEDYRKYYYGVGEKHNWLDRMFLDDEKLHAAINAPGTEIFIMTVDGKNAGFAEFIIEKNFTEILYFGLFPGFVGKGWGNYFLQWAIQQAWSYQPKWIQLNTCTLDHPNALPVYKKAGFEEVRTEIQERKVLV